MSVRLGLLALMKIKKEDKPLLIRCDCSSFEFLEFGWFQDEPKIFYLSITCNPKTWKEKLLGIWRLLRGSKFGISDEVLLNEKDIAELYKWISKRI